MTTYLKDRKGNKLELNGDLLTGDTFAAKDYIKSSLSGEWVASRKAWRVDVAKVEQMVSKYAGLYIDKDPKTSSSRPNADGATSKDGWCDRCHSYCYGDCRS